jgi:hypothetical protein
MVKITLEVLFGKGKYAAFNLRAENRELAGTICGNRRKETYQK